MPVVNYSSSDSDDETIQKSVPSSSGNKRRKVISEKPGKAVTQMPSLPNSFLDLYATNVRTGTADDPTLHGGRKRAIPHIDGNWQTHVYLEWWPNGTERGILHGAIEGVRKGLPADHQLNSHLNSELNTALPLHISLSRPIVLVTDNKDTFGEQLSEALSDLHVAPFRVTARELAWVSNWEATRWFLVLKLDKPEGDELNRLLDTINNVAVRFGQPKLYDDIHPKTKKRAQTIDPPNDFSSNFHISIAWSISAPDVTGNIGLDKAPLNGLSINFDSIKAKIGNGVFNIPLTSETLDLRGFGHG